MPVPIFGAVVSLNGADPPEGGTMNRLVAFLVRVVARILARGSVRRVTDEWTGTVRYMLPGNVRPVGPIRVRDMRTGLRHVGHGAGRLAYQLYRRDLGQTWPPFGWSARTFNRRIAAHAASVERRAERI
jgi:hypothetical protein